MKTAWDLNLLYSSVTDPRIEKDLHVYEKACEDFEKRYRDAADFMNDEKKLEAALKDYEKLYALAEPRRAYMYFYFRINSNSADYEAEQRLNTISDRLTKASNHIVFFELALGKIDPKIQERFLQSKTLKLYNYFLKRIFKTAKYNLTEPEEKILNLKSLPSQTLWVQGQEKILNQQIVTFKRKILPLSTAQNLVPQLPTIARRKLADEINKVLKSISYFSESEINAVYTDKKINDELRGFAHPYSATFLANQNDEETIITFIQTVTKHFSLSHRFYKLKAKLLKQKKLQYADRAARVGNGTFKPTFEESYSFLQKAFEKADPRFKEILDEYIKNGQIDVFPRKGKRGGAYCLGDVHVPTFILLNHTNSLNSLTTFAHEMGHAIHTELSKSQPILYQHYATSTAEVASTFFEHIAFEEVLPQLSKKEQIIALHDRINDAISSIFRQVAVFNYELEMHNLIREKGALSKEDMAALHNKHMAAYLGPLFTLKELDGYFFVSWSHLRLFFYVYSYAYGELISTALYTKWKENKKYIHKIKQFLSAGGSKSPEDIFKEIGIDTSKPEFFEAGLKNLERDIITLESLLA